LSWQEVTLHALNVLQVVALAAIAAWQLRERNARARLNGQVRALRDELASASAEIREATQLDAADRRSERAEARRDRVDLPPVG
jgi:hypothetical protein